MDLQRIAMGLGEAPALILVDMINAFTDPACELGSECDSVVRANQRLLNVFRERSLPIFFTTVVYSNDEQAQVFRQRLPALNILTRGSSWVDIDARMDRKPDEPIIEKQWASGFFATDLADRLRAAKVDSIVVTGLTTSGCVRATALDGLQHNFKVVVASDAVGDRNPEAHVANLFDLNAKYADVVSTDDIEQLVRKISEHNPGE